MVGPLCGAARGGHGENIRQGGGAGARVGGLLARRREECDAHAHLRHRLGERGAAQAVQGDGGGGLEARPPHDRARARPLLDPGAGGRRPRVLAPQGRANPQHHRDVLEGHARQEGLRAGVHAAHRRRGSLEAVGALRLLRRRDVRPDGRGGRRVPDQADELPVPRAHVQGPAALLQEPAPAVGRARHRVPLRAFGHALGALPRARLHAGRRARLLQARAGLGRDPGDPGPDGGGPVQVRLRRLRDLPLDAPGKEHRGRQLLGTGHQRPHRGAEQEGLEVHGQRGRRRVLRAEDRPHYQGRPRAQVAVLHGAVRLQPTQPLRARVHRARWQQAAARHDTPRHFRFGRALLRHRHRELRGRVPALAGAGAAPPPAHQRRRAALLQAGGRRHESQGDPMRGRRLGRACPEKDPKRRAPEDSPHRCRWSSRS
mmetsp:Transcript_72647/g.205418  ORF Transcript_72647/g.205418 Transcript_72647/m.205418 type:complete len:429 (+) Transcript_72647:607-1893(+)